jgi:cysteinyl-tRNA synthetase
MLEIYNSLSRKKEPFKPMRPHEVRMYVCGLTVYDHMHIGHARMLVAFDMVSRWLRASGFKLTYVRNITDIDDKIIKRAIENKESVQTLTERFIGFVHEDERALKVLPPDVEPKATQSIEAMVAMIGLLMDKGFAYQGSDGDVFYAPGLRAVEERQARRTLLAFAVGCGAPRLAHRVLRHVHHGPG